MKELFKAYEIAEMKANEADEAFGNDPENEELEAAFDKAYKEEYKAFENLVNAIVEISKGKIENKIARLMIRTKRNELKALLSRM